jgi:tetratricopeptide (TPR) repeat protein
MDDERFESASRLRDQGRLEEALEEFRTLARETIDPIERAGVAIQITDTLLRANRADLAKIELGTVRATLANLGTSVQEPNSDERIGWLRIGAQIEEADISKADGRPDEALAKLESLASELSRPALNAIYRDSYEIVQLSRAYLLCDLGRWNEALPVLEEADAFEEPRALIDFYLGCCYAANREYGKARERLVRALKIGGLPPNLESCAHSILGQAYHALGDYSQARLELERGVKTAPVAYIKQAKLWNWLEATCLHLGLKDEAEHYAQLARTS